MRWVGAALFLAVLGCATSGSDPAWVRQDGTPGDPAQLKRDRVACFPTVPELGPGSVARADAEDCMRRRGWVLAH